MTRGKSMPEARTRRFPLLVYKLMLISAALIWGGSFVVMKDTIDALPPSWLIGVRFVVSALLLTVLFLRRVRRTADRKALAAGGVLGILIFAAYWFQTVGLVYTTPGKNAFLTDTYCVIVPFIFWIVVKKAPTKFNVVAAVLCIAGVGFVSLSSIDRPSIELGDAFTLVSGVIYALHIVATALFAKKRDILVLTIYQLWVSGVLALLVGALTEPTPDWAIVATPDYLFNLVYLIVFASCVSMIFQNVALEHVPAASAAIFLSLESVFGVVFSVIFYGEALSAQLLLGFALIFVAIILSEVFPLKRPPKEMDEAIIEDIMVD